MDPQDVGICLSRCLKHNKITIGLIIFLSNPRQKPFPGRAGRNNWELQVIFHLQFQELGAGILLTSLLLAWFSFILSFSSFFPPTGKSLSKQASDSDHPIAYFPSKPVAAGVRKDRDPPLFSWWVRAGESLSPLIRITCMTASMFHGL